MGDLPIARLSLAITLGVLAQMAGTAQISPGKLSTAHASLEGATKCTSCHVLGTGAPKFRCETCHQEIKSRVDAKQGFHGRAVTRAGGGKSECVRCHTEHYGANFNIVKWETSRDEFDHSKTGYRLAGKHASVSCGQCHQPKNIAAEQAKTIAVRDKRRTLLGLSASCESCHQDVHDGELGRNCQRCHVSQTSWKNPEKFDHSQARFTLLGRHAAVKCASCHRNSENTAGRMTHFRGIEFSTCAGCHRDPHNGAFRAPCQNCHRESGWKDAAPGQSFDHTKTKFPLEGAHADKSCGKCHAGLQFGQPVAHARCADCHAKDDAHKGQFAKQDCAACHSNEAFKPSTYSRSRHRESAYPLVGKHGPLECTECHKKTAGVVDYKPVHAECRSCHRDSHEGSFLKSESAGKCESCHHETGFAPADFAIDRHERSRFVLSGAHAAIPCGTCHRPAESGKAGKFSFGELRCTECHRDPHRSVRSSAAKYECQDCHTTAQWQAIRPFDHGKTQFPLTGQHRAVRCAECHQSENEPRPISKPATPRLAFDGAKTACEGCHKDPHGHQFATAGATDCRNCHNSGSWKPVKFDHETQTRFSLTGAHRAVRCLECHKQTELVDGNSVVFYQRAPSACAACHDAAHPGRRP